MAKGNLFLGTAARSVGDVVMYRREGSQVSRVRVRKVANPRTDAQSLQRAAFSPVAKFFSPLAVVLERAFEGVSKSRSYSEFLKVNIKKARENGWLLPKGTGFFPLPYQLTKGTLPSFTYQADNAFTINVPGLTSAATTVGALSTVLIANGYKDGDIITIICVTSNGNSALLNNYVPHTMQFVIDSESTDAISTIASGQINIDIDADLIACSSKDGDIVMAGAVIVARFENDKWRRSQQVLAVDATTMTTITSAQAKAAAVASYGNTAGNINPLVYLDGKDLED